MFDFWPFVGLKKNQSHTKVGFLAIPQMEECLVNLSKIHLKCLWDGPKCPSHTRILVWDGHFCPPHTCFPFLAIPQIEDFHQNACGIENKSIPHISQNPQSRACTENARTITTLTVICRIVAICGRTKFEFMNIKILNPRPQWRGFRPPHFPPNPPPFLRSPFGRVIIYDH